MVEPRKLRLQKASVPLQMLQESNDVTGFKRRLETRRLVRLGTRITGFTSCLLCRCQSPQPWPLGVLGSAWPGPDKSKDSPRGWAPSGEGTKNGSGGSRSQTKSHKRQVQEAACKAQSATLRISVLCNLATCLGLLPGLWPRQGPGRQLLRSTERVRRLHSLNWQLAASTHKGRTPWCPVVSQL